MRKWQNRAIDDIKVYCCQRLIGVSWALPVRATPFFLVTHYGNAALVNTAARLAEEFVNLHSTKVPADDISDRQTMAAFQLSIDHIYLFAR
jgi:hypothetical protein